MSFWLPLKQPKETNMSSPISKAHVHPAEAIHQAVELQGGPVVDHAPDVFFGAVPDSGVVLYLLRQTQRRMDGRRVQNHSQGIPQSARRDQLFQFLDGSEPHFVGNCIGNKSFGGSGSKCRAKAWGPPQASPFQQSGGWILPDASRCFWWSSGMFWKSLA